MNASLQQPESGLPPPLTTRSDMTATWCRASLPVVIPRPDRFGLLARWIA